MINLNSILVLSLATLAFISFCLLLVIIPIALQLSRTLNSTQHLLDTINDDFEPTVKEIKQSVDGVRNVIQKSTTSVKSGINNTSILLVSSAYGVLAAVKEYLSSYKINETSYNNKGKVKR